MTQTLDADGLENVRHGECGSSPIPFLARVLVSQCDMIRIFWISFANSTRYAFMKCQMDRFSTDLGFEHQWVPAVRSDQVVLEDATGIRTGRKGGCLASHLLAIRAASAYMRKHSKRYAVIFEDDVDMAGPHAFSQRPSVLQIINATSPDWEIVQLGYHTYGWGQLRARTRGIVTPKLNSIAWCLMSYVVSRQAAEMVMAGGSISTVNDTVTMIRTKRKCKDVSADGCLMNGNIIGRRWVSYLATPPVFWEPPLKYKHFASTVGSNQYLRTMSRDAAIQWNGEVYGKFTRDNPRHDDNVCLHPAVIPRFKSGGRRHT